MLTEHHLIREDDVIIARQLLFNKAFKVEDDIPYESVMDFVATIRAACIPGGPFDWPPEGLQFQKALQVATHHCPPGIDIPRQGMLWPWPAVYRLSAGS